MVTLRRIVSLRCRAAAAAAGLVLAPLGIAPASAESAQAQRCTPTQRQAALREDRQAVLQLLGHEQQLSLQDHTVLETPAELAALAVSDESRETSYSILDHLFASAGGMGIGVVDSVGLDLDRVRPGKPGVLLYAPVEGTSEEAATEPFVPDFPYRLVGWAYAKSYTPGQPPDVPAGSTLRCITRADWFVHERSVHPFDTWQNVPAPPEERHHGDAAGQDPIQPHECVVRTPCPPGIEHSRLWDLHLWLADDGAPGDDELAVTIVNERATIPGWDPDVGRSFFYPDPQAGRPLRGSL